MVRGSLLTALTALTALLAAAAAATAATSVVDVALLCDVGTANREECDAARAAVDAINNKTDGVFDDLLPETVINATITFASCGQVFDAWEALPIEPVATIGPGCSTGVKAVSSAAARLELNSRAVVLSESSTSTSISDRDEYPNVVRLASSEAIVMEALAALVGHYGWQRIAVVYDSSDVWASDAAKIFSQKVDEMGGEVLGNACVTQPCERLPEAGDIIRGIRFNEDDLDADAAKQVLEELESVDARIVYIAARPDSQRPIFEQVKKTGRMYGAGYAWLSGWLSEDILFNKEDGTPNTDAIEGAQGLLLAVELPNTEGEVFRKFAEHRAEGLTTACAGEWQPCKYCDIDGDPMTLTGYGANAVDAVLTLAMALDTLAVQDRQDSDKVYEAISALGEFEGASGRIVLDELNERQGSMTIANLQLIVGGALGSGDQRRLAVTLFSTVADFVPVGKIVDGVFVEGGVIHTDGEYYRVKFPGSTTDVPADRDDEGSGSSKNKGHRKLSWWVWLAIFGSFGGCLLLGAACYGLYRLRSALRRKKDLEKSNTTVVVNQVTKAVESVEDFSAPFQLVAASVVVSMETLTIHEILRDNRQLVVLDRLEDVLENYSWEQTGTRAIVFFSHQWLGNRECDPEGAQLECMKAALQSVAARSRLALEDLYVWVDVCSIPQRNAGIKGLSILSLPAYAGASDYFVAVVPDARNIDSGNACTRDTYLRRAWCRAEILSFFVRRGPAYMYYLDSPDADLEPMLPSTAEGSLPDGFCDLIDVFHGDMTCCALGHRKGTVTCDREKLVKPMLGLLVELYRDRHDDPAARAIWDAIEPNLSRLYPKRFDYAVGKSGKTESRPLFGDLIEAMYYYLEKPESDGIAPHFAPGATSLLSPKFRYNPSYSLSPEQTPNLRQTLTSASSGRSRARSVRRIAVPSPEPGDGDESVSVMSSQDTGLGLGLSETRTSTHTLRMTTP